jgi:hypothetical protein
MKAWVSFAKTGNPGWEPMVPKIFGENITTSPEIKSTGIFQTEKERLLWSGFMHRVELDTELCIKRAAKL